MTIKDKQKYVKKITERIIRTRGDLSPHLIHLTRDTSQSAFDNLKSIINQGIIKALSCDFPQSKEFSDQIKNIYSLNTCSFTDTPENQITNLTDSNLKRQKKLQPYGIAFKKDAIINANGNPVHYIYCKKLQKYYNSRIYDTLEDLNNGVLTGTSKGSYSFLTLILPFIKYVTDKNNWAWEREWKMIGDFQFQESDIVKIFVRNEIEADQIRSILPNNYKLTIQCLDEEKEIIYEKDTDRFLNSDTGEWELYEYEQKVVMVGENTWGETTFLSKIT